MNIALELPFSDEEFQSAKKLANEGKSGPLRTLCRKEVQRFDENARQHPAYRDGLTQIERLAVEGYLYQKLRGHIDAAAPTHHDPSEG